MGRGVVYVDKSIDTQFAFGIAFPIPATFFTTGGSPPFIPDSGTPTDSNEPYLDVSLSRFDPFLLLDW